MSTFYASLAGHHVTVFTSLGGAQERTDTGTLTAIDEHWVQLAKDNGDRLLYPASSIRVIKLLDVAPSFVPADESPRLAAPDAVPAAGG